MSPLCRSAVLAALVFVSATLAETPPGYQKAPEAVRKILDLPPSPDVSVSPGRDFLVLASRQSYPSITQLSRPILRLAGLRFDPVTNGPQRGGRTTGYTLMPIAGGPALRLALPEGMRPGALLWSPDGKRFAFSSTTEKGIELWLGSPDTPRVRRVPGVVLNAVLREPIRWLADGKTLLCHTIPPGRGTPPPPPRTPPGPVIQETAGKAAPARTYQDLLRNPHDEALFDYHATAQLVLVDTQGKRVTTLGKPGIFTTTTPSPDGKYLLVTTVERPYSYVLPLTDFPRRVEVWDRTGKVVHRLAHVPLADRVPIGGVVTGPRGHAWRSSAPATVVWVEALDGGDPKKKVEHRDRVLALAAPFTDKPSQLARTQHRFSGLTWGAKGLALLGDFDREKRRSRTFAIDVDHPDRPVRLLWDLSIQDRYRHPGTPLLRRLPSGHPVLRQQGEDLFLVGDGATAKGDRPFLDRFHLPSRKTTRLFQSATDCLERPVDLLTDDGSTFLTRHESPTSPPNYRVRLRGKDAVRALTHFEDPAPELRKITRRLVTYQRGDGVTLSFTLYLPPGYKEGTRLPTVLWAYPREFTDPALAGQVLGSTNRFTSLAGASHLFFLLAGYAVLDGATMPVVGSVEKANDTYIEQIVASARAAIDRAVELGVTDRDRVGVGGHSYGAFMTANLLAHSDLFRAGIARSGAYNRTLTPFGFQNERRTLWQAPEVYARMSPFMHAHKIKAPILFIHGEADNNPGTFPMQSERMFQAIRGNGGTARYVSLPHESHGYAARESIEHTLHEMIGWFDHHVKNVPSRSSKR